MSNNNNEIHTFQMIGFDAVHKSRCLNFNKQPENAIIHRQQR